MLDVLRNKLKASVSFPSPPAIAQQIIALAGDPDIDLDRVAAAIGKDPGLAAKILRVANSPLYAKRRESGNLRQALVVLGLNAATTLALSFSLVGTYKAIKSTGIDYVHFWRKTILSASAARTFAEMLHVNAVEEVFLAALLQDIAVLAVDRAAPDFYAELPRRAAHAQLAAYEHARLGLDHASLGAWLLRHWKLPEPLCRAVEGSHSPLAQERPTNAGVAAACAALGSECVEMLLGATVAVDIDALADRAHALLRLSSGQLAAAIDRIVAEIPEIERLFDTALLRPDEAAAMLEQARELLTMRNLRALEAVNMLQAATADLEARTTALEDRQRRDALTGVYNRGHLDQILQREFQAAGAGGWPLSIGFIDLDNFKKINDTYGHPTGDSVLAGTAKQILSVTRATDCVARYGGDEFLIVLPGLEIAAADTVCRRLLHRLRAAQYPVDGGFVNATASVGLAAHGAETPYYSVAQLIEAADRAVYAAKTTGRDRLMHHDPARCSNFAGAAGGRMAAR